MAVSEARYDGKGRNSLAQEAARGFMCLRRQAVRDRRSCLAGKVRSD